MYRMGKAASGEVNVVAGGGTTAASHASFRPARLLSFYPTRAFDLGIRMVTIYQALSYTLLPTLSLIAVLFMSQARSLVLVYESFLFRLGDN